MHLDPTGSALQRTALWFPFACRLVGALGLRAALRNTKGQRNGLRICRVIDSRRSYALLRSADGRNARSLTVGLIHDDYCDHCQLPIIVSVPGGRDDHYVVAASEAMASVGPQPLWRIY
jgi:hypothetical protein